MADILMLKSIFRMMEKGFLDNVEDAVELAEQIVVLLWKSFKTQNYVPKDVLIMKI